MSLEESASEASRGTSLQGNEEGANAGEYGKGVWPVPPPCWMSACEIFYKAYQIKMKKLLLLICLMCGVGVSSATTYTVAVASVASSISTATYTMQAFICSFSDCYISRITRGTSDTCSNWFIVRPGDILVSTGTFVGVTGTINTYITGGGLFYIGRGSGGYNQTGNTCTHQVRNYTSTSQIPVNAGLFTGMSTNVYEFDSATGLISNVNNDNARMRPSTMTYSGSLASDIILTPPTIRYNGIANTGFAGTNIYINGILDNPTYSGSDIVFNVRSVFRGLFRQP